MADLKDTYREIAESLRFDYLPGSLTKGSLYRLERCAADPGYPHYRKELKEFYVPWRKAYDALVKAAKNDEIDKIPPADLKLLIEFCEVDNPKGRKLVADMDAGQLLHDFYRVYGQMLNNVLHEKVLAQAADKFSKLWARHAREMVLLLDKPEHSCNRDFVSHINLLSNDPNFAHQINNCRINGVEGTSFHVDPLRLSMALKGQGTCEKAVNKFALTLGQMEAAAGAYYDGKRDKDRLSALRLEFNREVAPYFDEYKRILEIQKKFEASQTSLFFAART